MAKVIPIGQPANESERQAIGFLRDHLPDGWLIFHNFEMRQGEEVFEIDIAILAPHAVYLVDVKGTRGNIDVYGSKWYPEGRQPFFSPLAKLRSHAKTMATIIRESNTGLIELRKAHVHANVLAVKDLFVSDDEDKVVLVTEDLPGQALRLHINKASLALTFDQKLQVMRDVLSALDHAHRHEVIHRNLTPDAILVTKGGQARVTGFDFARVGKNRTSTIADQVVDDLEAAYQAPECFKDPTQASIASDLYAAGLIFYELLTGELPFESVDQMMEADGRFPMKPSEHKPDLPKGIDEWLQKFCEFDPEERHTSAAIARKGLDDLILPEAKNDQSTGESIGTPEQGARRAAPKDGSGDSAPENDLMNLPQDFILADRFRIQKKLGSGGFGVAYKVRG